MTTRRTPLKTSLAPLALIGAAVWGGSASALHTTSLMDMCSREGELPACRAYIEAVLDVSPQVVTAGLADEPRPEGKRTVLGYCLPENPKTEVLVDRVMVEIRHLDPIEHDNAAASVLAVLNEMHPCD